VTITDSNAVSAAFTGDTGDYIFAFRKRKEYLRVAVVREIASGPATTPDIVGGQQQAVTMKHAGIQIIHPGTLYVGRNI
jgi:hypothetical protein